MAHKTRRCTACLRPCKGHRGPTGSRCQEAYARGYQPMVFSTSDLCANRFTPLEETVSSPTSPSPPRLVRSAPLGSHALSDSDDYPPLPRASRASFPPATLAAPGTVPLTTCLERPLLSESPAHSQSPFESPARGGYSISTTMATQGNAGAPSTPTPGSSYPPATNVTYAPLTTWGNPQGVHVVQTINGPVATTQTTGWPRPPVQFNAQPMYQENPWASHGGHSLPPSLWQGLNGHNNPVTTSIVASPAPQSATPAHEPLRLAAPAQQLPAAHTTLPPWPPQYPGVQLGQVNYSQAPGFVQPSATIAAPPQVNQVLPTCAPYTGPTQVLYQQPTYVTAMPQPSGPPAAPTGTGYSFHHQVAPQNTNAIHPTAIRPSNPAHRHQVDLGLEFLDNKTIESALAGECVNLEDFISSQYNECDELKSHIDFMGNVQVKTVKSRKSVSNVLKWLECWVNYEMLMSRHFGHAVYVEMAKYRSFMIGISQKYKFSHVNAYDVRHRQRLAHTGSFLFSLVDHDLYVTKFDSSAVKGSSKCSKCASIEHTTSECSVNKPTGAGRGTNKRGSNRGRRGGTGRSEICYNYQTGNCNWGGDCIRRHKCAGCGGDNPQSSCPTPSCKTAVAKAAVQPST